jgi:DNA-binding CsgD family transcriptional regulator
MTAGRPLSLSERERECAELAARGLSNREIAGELRISESAVNGYIERLKCKLDAESRIEAIVLSLKAGLIKVIGLAFAASYADDLCAMVQCLGSCAGSFQ